MSSNDADTVPLPSGGRPRPSAETQADTAPIQTRAGRSAPRRADAVDAGAGSGVPRPPHPTGGSPLPGGRPASRHERLASHEWSRAAERAPAPGRAPAYDRAPERARPTTRPATPSQASPGQASPGYAPPSRTSADRSGTGQHPEPLGTSARSVHHRVQSPHLAATRRAGNGVSDLSRAHQHGWTGATMRFPRLGRSAPVEEDLDATGPVLAPLGHLPALDGLRAFAVLAVIAYHAGLSWMPGGLLGVDTFFVLSGFLITGLLITEYRNTRRIDLRTFWIRRTRRLLPALLALLVGVAAYARWVAAPGDVQTVRGDALATLFYVANWRFALSDQSYFQHLSAPSPLLHTWSLSVEEQFYVLWPLAVFMLMRHSARTVDRWRNQRRKAQALALAIAVCGAVASALVGLGLLLHGTDTSRIYYGTDSRAQALLIGAALAVWRGQRTHPISARARSVLSVVGVVAALALLAIWMTVSGQSRPLYAGGFLVVAVIVMLLVASIVEAPRGPLARFLALAPFTFIGSISYGLYLWHWPVFLTLTAARTGTNGVTLLVLRLAATLGVTLLSFHLVENPIRRGRLRMPKPWLSVPAAIGAVLAVLLVATASAPGSTRTPAQLEALARQAAAQPQAAVAVRDGGQPTKVLLGGDSVALTLGFSDFSAMAAEKGMEIHDFSMLGCGVSRVAERRFQGEVGPPPPGCDQWPARFAKRVAEVNPGLAMLEVGRWEVTDQLFEGRWRHVGDPALDAYLGRELDLAIQTLGAKGAKVVLLSTPLFRSTEAADGSIYPETEPERVVHFNELLRAAAARNPGTSTIDITSVLTPGNRYVDELDGVRLRDDDGVHISNGGAQRIGAAIIPELVRIVQTPPGRPAAGLSGTPGSVPQAAGAGPG